MNSGLYQREREKEIERERERGVPFLDFLFSMCRPASMSRGAAAIEVLLEVLMAVVPALFPFLQEKMCQSMFSVKRQARK
jgi:hypothetical protein